MLKRNDDLIINRGLIPANINCSSPQIAADNAAFIATLIADGGVLPQHPPFEIHPYLNEFPLQNYEKYIIGTFPPSYRGVGDDTYRNIKYRLYNTVK